MYLSLNFITYTKILWRRIIFLPNNFLKKTILIFFISLSKITIIFYNIFFSSIYFHFSFKLHWSHFLKKIHKSDQGSISMLTWYGIMHYSKVTKRMIYGPFGLRGERRSWVEQSKIGLKITYFQPTLLYSPSLHSQSKQILNLNTHKDWLMALISTCWRHAGLVEKWMRSEER